MHPSLARQRLPQLVVAAIGVVVLGVTSACSSHPTQPEELELSRRRDIGCVSPALPDVPPDTIPPLVDGSCLPGFDQISWW